MDRSKIDFSVIIPAYNCAGTLPAAIESVRSSGLRNREIVVVDDGSTDDTGAVLDRLAERCEEIVPVHRKNGGVSSARNCGIRSARGKYLLFLDADDVVSKDAYRHAAEIVDRLQPDLLIFGMRFERYGWKTCYQIEEKLCPKEGLLSSPELAANAVELFKCNYLSSACNKLIRRELLMRTDIRFPETMFLMEDAWFSLECFRHSNTVYLLPEPVYRYILPVSNAKNNRRLRRIGSVTDYMRHFSSMPPEYDGVKKLIYYMLMYQQVWALGSVRQLKKATADLKRSGYVDAFADRPMVQNLLRGRYRTILLRRGIRFVRARLVVLYKVLRTRLTGKMQTVQP